MALRGIPSVAPEGSIGKPTGATNLVTNGDFETNTSGWATAGTNTIASSTDQAKFGSRSLKCTYSNDTQLAYYAITLTAVAHSMGVWVYVPTAYNGTQPQLFFNGFTGASGTLTANVNLSLRDQWQFVTVPNVTPAGGDLSGFMLIFENGSAPTAGRFLYIDGAQCELGAISTPYANGTRQPNKEIAP